MMHITGANDTIQPVEESRQFNISLIDLSRMVGGAAAALIKPDEIADNEWDD
jgi:hypothetical protein